MSGEARGRWVWTGINGGRMDKVDGMGGTGAGTGSRARRCCSSGAASVRRRGARLAQRLVALGIIAGVLSPAWAGTLTPATEYRDKVKVAETVQPLGDSPFGENVNLYKGGLSFSQTDISFPGIGPTITLVRGFELGGGSARPFGAKEAGDWSLSIPRIQTILPGDLVNKHGAWLVGSPSSTARCTGFSKISISPYTPLGQHWWNGYQLLTADGASQSLLKRAPENTIAPASGTYNIVTANHWMIGCLPSTANGVAGEAFLATAPDGTRYWFNQLVDGPPIETLELVSGQIGLMAGEGSASATTPVGTSSPDASSASGTPTSDIYAGGDVAYTPRKMGYMFVTRVEDRFGNYITYNYTNNRISSITGSDGRLVTIAWRATAPVVTSITIEPTSGAPQTWTYVYASDTSNILARLVLPDQSAWTFAMNGVDNLDFDTYEQDEISRCGLRYRPNQYTPGFATATAVITHPSGLVGAFDINEVVFGRSMVPTFCNGTATASVEAMPTLYLAYSLTRKTVSGPGIATQVWGYSYSNAVGSSAAECASVACAGSAYVEVIAPDGSISRYTHSNKWDFSEGKLLGVIAGLSSLGQTNPAGIQRNWKAYAPPTQGPWPTRVGDGLDHWGVMNNAPAESISPQSQSITELQGATFSRRTTAFDAYGNPLSVTRSSTGGAGGDFSRSESLAYMHDLSRWVIGLPTTITCVGGSDCGVGKVISRTDYTSADLPWHAFSYEILQQTLGYSANGMLASIQDGRGNVTTAGDWYRGVPRLVTLPGSPASAMSAVVSPTGLITDVIDPVGARTCYAYDAAGRVTGVTYPSEASPGTCNTSAWSATSRGFTQVAVAEYGIPAGHWKQVIATGNGRTSTFLDARWQPMLTLTEDIGNPATRSFVVTKYDLMGRPVFKTYPVGSLVSVDDLLTGDRTVYDVLGRVTQVQQGTEPSDAASSLTTTTTYLNGFRTQVRNPRGYATTTSYQAYDTPSTDTPVEIVAPEGVRTTIYRQPSLSKPLGIARDGIYAGATVSATRRYVYDANEQLCETINPESGATVVDYDTAGNIAWSADGQLSSGMSAAACSNDRVAVPITARRIVNYDTQNKPLSVTSSGGAANVTTTYEADGMVRTLVASNGPDVVTTQYSYNARRLLTRETLQVNALLPWTFDYAYNGAASLSSQTYPGGLLVGYAPDALGRPTQVGSFASGVTYYPNGAISGFTYGNGIVHTMTQNARLLPAGSLDAYGTTKILDDAYDYDANGNVVSMIDALPATGDNRTRTGATYDGLDRLLSAVSPNQWGTATYTYDALDNLRSSRIGLSTQSGFDYNYNPATNLLASLNRVGGGTYAYTTNPAGDITTDGRQSYKFDIAHRLTSVTGKESYLYDGNGRRARTLNATTGTIEYFGYGQDGRLLQDWSNRRGVRNAYVYLGNTLVGLYEVNFTTGARASRYKHTDALGSPVATTDVNRVVLNRSSYTPYGVPVTPVDGVGYTGHFVDVGTGLTYMQQRYYDPQIGRFLSVDPADSGFNLYNYANNNPYRSTDPDGRSPIEIAFLVADAIELGSSIGSGEGIAMAALNVGIDIVGVASPIPGISEVAHAIEAVQKVERVGEAVKGVEKVAESAKALHGNSAASAKLQHRYEISAKATGDVKKTGISGAVLNKSGSSARANKQVNSLNKAAGSEKYAAGVRETGIPGRAAALDAERSATAQLKSEGHSLELQCRPDPNKGC